MCTGYRSPLLTLLAQIILLAVFIAPRISLGLELCPTQTLSQEARQIDPVASFCFHEDTQGDATAADFMSGKINLQPIISQELVFSHTQSTYWLAINLHNTDNAPSYWFLQLGYAPLDHVDFYLHENDQHRMLKTGDREVFDSRGIDYRFFLLPMQFSSNEMKTVLIKIKSQGAINLPLSLYTPGALISSSSRLGLLQGLFYGALLILSLFNGLLYITTRINHYFFNAFYMASTGLFMLSMGGLSFQYLWPHSPWLANVAIPFSAALLIISFILFGRSFLDITHLHHRMSKIITILIIINCINLTLALVAPYHYIIKWVSLWGIISIATFFLFGIKRINQGFMPARWYVTSWAVMFVGTAVYILAAFGYLANYMATEMLMQLSIGGQVLLLNYALALRIRLLNERLLAIESHAKLALEQQVRERTRQLECTMRDLERANAKLEELSVRDKLTGLFNRRHFDNALRQAFVEARRQNHPLAMVFFDADHFKCVNDQYGHLVGDQCLQHMAVILRSTFHRPKDTVARYGGEEFAVILPCTDIHGAEHIVRQALHNLQTNPAITDAGTLNLTFSAGLALIYPGQVNTENETTLLQQADQALYAAKKNGRNRLEIHTEGLVR